MTRKLRVSLISIIALTLMLAVMPAPAAARVFVRGGWGWGPGWYGAGYWGPGYYSYLPYGGTVKIVTPAKDASVFVDGGYAGTVKQMHKFSLRPGAHDLAVKAPNGQPLYNQRIEVIRGKTLEVHPGS
jgi:hypothetical protein